MYIKSLEVKNFKSLDHIKLNFDHINIIKGPNGSGKSSLIEAIKIALLPNSSTSLTEYIKKGKRFLEIILEYEVPSVGPITSRIYVDSSNKEIELRLKNKALTKKTEIYEYLNSIGLEKDIFLNSCISLQHRSTDFIFSSDATKAKLLRDLFRIEKLRLLENLLKDKAKEFSDNIKVLIETNKAYEVSLNNFSSIEKKLSNIDSTKIRKAKKIYNKLNQLKQKYEEDLIKYLEEVNLIEKKKRLESKKEELNEKLVSIKAKKYYKEKIERLFSLIEQKETVLNSNLLLIKDQLKDQNENLLLAKEKITLFKEYMSLKSKRSSIRKHFKEFESFSKEGLKDIESSIINLEKKKSSLQYSLEKNANQKKAAELGECFVCGSKFHTSLDHLIQEEKKLKEELETLSLRLEEKRKLKATYEKALAKKESLEIDLEDKNKEISALKEKILSIKPKYDKKLLKKLELEKSSIERKLDRFKILKTRLKSALLYTENFLKEESSIREEYEKTLKDLKAIPSNLKIRNRPSFTKEKWIKDIYEKYISKENLLAELKENFKKINEIKTIMESNTTNIGLLETKISLIKDFIKYALGNFSAFILQEGITAIETIVNSFLEEVYPKYKIKIEYENNTLKIYYLDSNNQYVSIDLASGFELQLLSLALRASFSKFYNYNLLILDEADESASEDNSEKLFDFLTNLKEFQIFYVSHKKYLDSNKYIANFIVL